MLVQEIKYGLTTLNLHAEECHLMAEACETALENEAGCGCQADVLHLEAMGAAFAAAAIAANLQLAMFPGGDVMEYE